MSFENSRDWVKTVAMKPPFAVHTWFWLFFLGVLVTSSVASSPQLFAQSDESQDDDIEYYLPTSSFYEQRDSRSKDSFAAMTNAQVHGTFNEAVSDIGYFSKVVLNRKKHEESRRIEFTDRDGRVQIFTGKAYVQYAERRLDQARDQRDAATAEFEIRLAVIERENLGRASDYRDAFYDLRDRTSEINGQIIDFSFGFEDLRTGSQTIAMLQRFLKLWNSSKNLHKRQFEYRDRKVDFVRVNRRQRWIDFDAPGRPFEYVDEDGKVKKSSLIYVNPKTLIEKNLQPAAMMITQQLLSGKQLASPIVCRRGERQQIVDLILSIDHPAMTDEEIYGIRSHIAANLGLSGLWHAQIALMHTNMSKDIVAAYFDAQQLEALKKGFQALPDSEQKTQLLAMLDQFVEAAGRLTAKQKEQVGKEMLAAMLPIVSTQFFNLPLDEQIYELQEVQKNENGDETLRRHLVEKLNSNLFATDVATLRLAMSQAAKKEYSAAWATLNLVLLFNFIRDQKLFSDSFEERHKKVLESHKKRLREAYEEGLELLSSQSHREMSPELALLVSEYARGMGDQDDQIAVTRIISTAANPNDEPSNFFYIQMVSTIKKKLNDLD